MRVFIALLIIACLVVAGPTGSYSAFAQAVPGKDAAQPDTLKFRRPVLFVLVLGSNPDLRARVSVAMTRVLGDELSLNVVPEPEWAIKDYIDQCKSDASTAGAFIVQPPGYGSREIDSLVTLRNIATVQFNAMISTCPQFYELHDISPRPTPGPPEITWVAKTSKGEFGRTFVQFLPFAVLTSVYLAFAPQRVYQTTTTHTNPAPSPIPSGGYNSSVQTVYSNTINASGTSSLQNSIVTSVGAAALDFGQKGDVNNLTLRAAEAGAWDFMQGYKAYCDNQSRGAVLPHNAVDQATFCAWLHPFVAGKITYQESKSALPQPAHDVPVTLTPVSWPSSGPATSLPPAETTRTDCLGTYHFTNVQPGATYRISVADSAAPIPAEHEVTVQATGDGARQIADFAVGVPIATPCPSPPASPSSQK